ncbi:MAG TPA: hypothetical protein VKA38_07290 [Draconibacterium sp.]|nr:hypothetical protein [Draconibacterium sp.]
MDDLVVIILTLLIVVLGVIGQIKKKRPVQPNASQNNNSGGFWDLLEGEPEFVGQPQEFNSPVVEPEPTEMMSEEPEYKFTPSNEGKSNIEREFSKILKEEKTKKILDENFSLRKAIIYSEIINRKYI